MPSSEQALRALLLRDAHRLFLADLVGEFRTWYRDAWRECQQRWIDPVARDLRPQVCRADIEHGLPLLTARHTDVASIANRHNWVNRCSHMEVMLSGALVLTQCTVTHPNERFNDAEFRKNLAARSQLPLPSVDFAPQRALGSLTYGVVLHGADRSDWSQPAFVHVVFPGDDCTDILARVDLLRWYEETVVIDTTAEVVEDPAAAAVRLTGRRLVLPGDAGERRA